MVIYRNKLCKNWSYFFDHQIGKIFRGYIRLGMIIKQFWKSTSIRLWLLRRNIIIMTNMEIFFQLFLRNTFCGFLRYLLRHQGLFNSVKRIPVHFIDGCNCKIYYMHRCYYYSVITTKIAYSTQCNKPFWSYVHVIFYA